MREETLEAPAFPPPPPVSLSTWVSPCQFDRWCTATSSGLIGDRLGEGLGPGEGPGPVRMRLKDGGGLGSDADGYRVSEEPDLFQDLRLCWWSRIQDWNLVGRLEAHVAMQSKLPLLSEEETRMLRADVASFLRKQGLACCDSVVPGQPLALDLLLGCLQLWSDIDVELPGQLEQGVSCGIYETIPASGVWRAVDVPERPPMELLVWDTPWPSGCDRPDLLQELVQSDVDAGFAEWLDGGLHEVQERFGSRCAAGKLGIIIKDGSAPRLVGDSTVSNVNTLCRIEEKIELPGLDSVAGFLSRHDSREWRAFSLDFQKAHKRVKIHPSDHGLNVFAVPGPAGERKWVVYKVCHFGASWASYWWSRVAAAFVRLGHHLLRHPRFLCIYVDDLLAVMPVRVAGPMACLLICLACSLGFPLSWSKLDFGASLQWIGWKLNFGASPQAILPSEKAASLLEALNAIISNPRAVPRRLLQKLVGRLVWYTAGALWLRPWLQVWFYALRKPGVHFAHLDSAQLEELRYATAPDCKVAQRCQLSDVQPGWRLVESPSATQMGCFPLL